VHVTTYVDGFGTKSLRVVQQVINDTTGEPCATCKTVMAGYSRTTCKGAVIPDTIKERILRYQKK
jgi:acyl-CoA thioester hydrolase